VTHCRNSRISLLAVFFLFGCNTGGLSNDEKREFEALDSALATHASSPAEDRAIRLHELEDVIVKTTRMKNLKDICLSSRKAIHNSEQLVDKIKAETLELEMLITEAKARAINGKELDAGQRSKIETLSKTANAAKLELDTEMTRAEQLLDSCQKNRFAIRALIIENR
jgi:hypothetical protein